MIDCNEFYDALIDEGLGMFAGVPDSLLKEICACITERSGAGKHIIAANEGAAVGLAAGSYLATGKVGLVYMQNSGFGNVVNPVLSLADPKVYSIPMLLLIGWRGEPGVKDEPQHVKQGEVMEALLDAMDIPYEVIGDSTADAVAALKRAVVRAEEGKTPVALVVRKGAFDKYPRQAAGEAESALPMNREAALEVILGELDDADVVVSTTGMASREIFECREKAGSGHERDFLTVGSMGHCSQIAMGISMSAPDKRVFCIDGDGAVIMHMGSMAIVGQHAGGNLLHIVLNNGKHDSVGGQPTVGFEIDLTAVARACGYAEAVSVDTADDLRTELARLAKIGSPTLLEVRVRGGARADLGRPTTSPIENKEAFMQHLARP